MERLAGNMEAEAMEVEVGEGEPSVTLEDSAADEIIATPESDDEEDQEVHDGNRPAPAVASTSRSGRHADNPHGSDGEEDQEVQDRNRPAPAVASTSTSARQAGNLLGSDGEEDHEVEDGNRPAPAVASTSTSGRRANNQHRPRDPPTLWNWLPSPPSQPSEPFDLTTALDFAEFDFEEDTELNLFLEYFTPEVLQLIADETNRFYQQEKAKATSQSRRMQNFKEASPDDIMSFIAVRICMGIARLPKETDYWSTNKYVGSRVIPLLMSSDRYKDLKRFLHFTDNENQPEGDRIYKIRTLWDLVMERMGMHCNPGLNMCVDESLVLYKGRLFWRQYIPSKAAKFGIKIFSIADSASGYILKSIIYQGSGHELVHEKEKFGFGGAIALDLMLPYTWKGRRLFADNYFGNAKMAKELLEKRTQVCAMTRRNAKDHPRLSGRMKKGEVEAFTSNGILYERWRDKRDVRIVSTGFPSKLVKVNLRSGRETMKPQTVIDYNQHARAIDKRDMVVGAYDTNRKSTKWYKKLFFYLVDTCIYNARIIWLQTNPTVSPLIFKQRVCDQILRRFGKPVQPRGRRSAPPTLARLTERHFLELVPPSEKNPHRTRDCVVCTAKAPVRGRKKRSQVRFQCKQCNVGLCPTACFEAYHSKEFY